MQRNTRIQFMPAKAPRNGPSRALKVVFVYPDKIKAQAVAAHLASEAVQQVNNSDALRERFWKDVWPISNRLPARCRGWRHGWNDL